MKNRFKVIVLLLFVAFVSCDNKPSLQSYLVESQEKSGFITLDVPTSFLQLKEDTVSDEVKETLKSIRKINVVAYPKKEGEETYELEKATLKTILKDTKKYKNLMVMKVKEMHVNMYYTGNSNSINEVIAFGYNNKMGFGVARLLGDNMNPAKIIEMMKSIKLDFDSLDLNQLKGLFSQFDKNKMK